MQALAFDHFFDQDLSALAAALGPGERLDVVGYQRFHRLARQHFDAEAFTGLAAAYSPTRDEQWTRYRRQVTSLVDRLCAAYRPDVFIAPTDAIFYLRPVIDRFAALGCPTVVVQKETTISPMVMTEHAEAVAAWVPFASDAMTVCSERQRQFWVNAGTDASLITVTGQPRFDVYARAHPARQETPTLLYFSYDDVAYLPSDTGVAYEGSWVQQRRETERVLAEIASAGTRVIAKRHPQQQPGPDWLGASVERAPQAADTRLLIAEADIVVGFQTTALFEAAAAGRPVVYAAWGRVYEEARHLLIPFHEWPDLASHATSPDHLRDTLHGEPPAPGPGARTVIEDNIGPVDGQASARALAVVRDHLGASQPVDVRSPSVLAAAGLAVGAGFASAGASLAERTGWQRAPRVRAAAAGLQELAREARALRRGADR